MNYKTICFIALTTLVLGSCKDKLEVQKPFQDEQIIGTKSLVSEGTTEESAYVNPDGKYAKMDFVNLEHDFGNINAKDVVETVFIFTNTGDADLIISKAQGSCGCTVPEYPKQPIAPGEKAEIKVSFSPAGKTAMQNKTVTLTTNTASGMEQLTVKANIVK